MFSFNYDRFHLFRRSVFGLGTSAVKGRIILWVCSALVFCLLGLHATIVCAQQFLNTTNFTVIYYTSGGCQLTPATTENPPYLLPDGTYCNDYSGHPDYIRKIACWLEYAHARYDGDGFDLPAAAITVEVTCLSTSGMVPGPVDIKIARYLDMEILPLVCCHELFHIVQLQYWKAHTTQLWFREAMAEAMMNTIVSEPCATDTCRFEEFFWHSNGIQWNHDFFHFPGAAWRDAYDVAIMWLYLMEHNGDDNTVSYPGVDFVRDFLDSTRVVLGPPSNAHLFTALDQVLANKGTDLDTELRKFAFANLVRVYDNLDYWNDYGYRWDDTYFPGGGTWSVQGVDEMAYGADSRVLDLNGYTSAATLPGYTDSGADNWIDHLGAAQYWEFDADLKDLISSAGGLSYDSVGLPYHIEIPSLGGVEHLAVTGYKDGLEIYHNSNLYFNDDRVVRAGVAITQNTSVNNYTFEYTIEPYKDLLDFEQTTDYYLAPHKILLLGIDHGGEHLSAVAFRRWDYKGTQIDYTHLDYPFQMNYRYLAADYYLNHDDPMVEPMYQHVYRHHYIQEAGPGEYRLDLRQSPDTLEYGNVMVTLFDYDIEAAALPDFLLRDAYFTIDKDTGILEGQVAILNQGTASETVRIAIFGETDSTDTLLLDPYISLDPCSTEIIDVAWETGGECRGIDWLEAIITVYVNSNEGLQGIVLPPPEELTRNNNGPTDIPVGVYCLDQLALDLSDFLEDAALDLMGKQQDYMELQHEVAEYGLLMTLELMEELESWLGGLEGLPYPIPERLWQTYDAFDWFRAVSEWMTVLGMGDAVPPLVHMMGPMTNMREIYFIAPKVLDLQIAGPSDRYVCKVECGSYHPSSPWVGDPNMDGTINVLDVVMVVNIIIDRIDPTKEQQMAADFNGDKAVNVLDALAIVNIILGTSSAGPFVE
jgi:hypothetical protein